AGLMVAGRLARGSRGAARAPDDARYRAMWGPVQRAAVEGAFLAVARDHGRETFDRVAAALDGHAAAWSAARVDACKATFERGEQSPALLDLRMRCLDRRLVEVKALVRVLTGANGATVDRAVDAVANVSRDLCRDAEALEPRVPLPADPAARPRIAELEDELARMRPEIEAGRQEAPRSRLLVMLKEARRLEYPPLIAGTLVELA